MKAVIRHIVFILLTFPCAAVTAQETKTDSTSFDSVFQACLSMQESLENNDTTALVEASNRLKKAETKSFESLLCKDDTISSLNGHFVFDKSFVDILEAGKDPYSIADKINSSIMERNQRSNGSIKTRTCLVKVGKSNKYTFVARGYQELGVITEPGGRVYVRVHVTNRSGLDVRYNDDKNAVKGVRRYRKAFNLPVNQGNTIELEVINKGNKDTSFVVISN